MLIHVNVNDHDRDDGHDRDCDRGHDDDHGCDHVLDDN